MGFFINIWICGTLLKANNIINSSDKKGIAKQHKQEELPLKMFARNGKTDAPFTGYIKKAIGIAKSRSSIAPVNINAKHLNEKFADELKKLEL